jgi:hypothetical protein
MKISIAILIILLFINVFTLNPEDKSEGIVEITSDSFEKLKKENNLLVEFYAPW